MNYHIHSVKELPGIPYSGEICLMAKITPGKVYVDEQSAIVDLHKLNKICKEVFNNKYCFMINPHPWILDGLWLAVTKNYVLIPEKWQKILYEKYNLKKFKKNGEDVLSFNASTDLANQIAIENFYYLKVLNVPKV